MRKIDSFYLNNTAHGYVFIPLLVELRNIGLFRYLKTNSEVSIDIICKDLKLNRGPLRIMINSIQGFGLVRLEKETLHYTSIPQLEREIELIPNSLLKLYEINPLQYLRQTQYSLFTPFISENHHENLKIFLEGCVMIPLFVALYQHNEGRLEEDNTVSFDGLSPVAISELLSLFKKYEWGDCHKDKIILTDCGKWIYEHALNYALGLSYRSLLCHFRTLLSGRCEQVFLDQGYEENHVDRKLNVLSSGSMHKSYFKSISHVFSEIFNNNDLTLQPAYIIDTGCGDGTFLAEVYEHVLNQTKRGKYLKDFPLLMIGVDYNNASLIETSKKLDHLNIPHMTIYGDIGNPAQILIDLECKHIDLSKRLLHIRSFLDHDRPYIPPQSICSLSSVKGAFMNRSGEEISPNEVLQSLKEHLERWQKILKPQDDLMIFEVHAIDPFLAFEKKDNCISLHFDLIQALSGQFLVSAEEFCSMAAQASLVSESLYCFPEGETFTRISFNHFRKGISSKKIEVGKLSKNVLTDSSANYFEKELSQETLFNFIKNELENSFKKSITIESSFLKLGLDSLELGKFALKLNTVLPFKISLSIFFKFPIVSDLIHEILLKLKTFIKKGEINSNIELGTKRQHYPLALSQEPMWIWFELIGETSAYNVPRIEHLKGIFSMESFNKALHCVISRHEILRTSYGVEDGIPYQHVLDLNSYPLPIEVNDISQYPMKYEFARQLIKKEINLNFDLGKGETFRVLLLHLSENEHILVITMHHIVTDGSSIPIFWNELVTAYNSYSQKKEFLLPSLKYKYFDWALQQRNQFQKGLMKEAIEYWQENLKGNLAPLELPVDFPYPKQQTFNGNRLTFLLSPQKTKELHAICVDSNATLFMAILAAWGLFLSKHTLQNEIIIGTPWANRDDEQVQDLIGCFVNTIPIRLQILPGDSFCNVIKRARGVCLNAYEHASLPFHKMVELLRVHSVNGRLPIYQTMVALEEENGWIRGDVFQELVRVDENDSLIAIRDTSKFEISLSIREKETYEGKHLTGEFVYNTDIFRSIMAEKMKNRFVYFLQNLIQNPYMAIQEVEIITENEQRFLIDELNQTDLPLPDVQSVFELFRAQVKTTPLKLALKWEHGSYTYEQLWEKIQQFTTYLVEKGIGREMRVAVMMERSPELIVTLFSLMQLGATYVPIDLDYPLERKKFILKDAEASFLIKQPHISFPDESIIFIDYAEKNVSQFFAQEGPYAQDIVYILYTSGTTGVPKGVQITHLNLLNNIWHLIQKEFSINDLELVLCATNICFDQSVEELFPALCVGGTILLVESSTDLWWRNESVTLVVTTPSLIAYIMQEQLPSTIQSLVLGGELLLPTLVEEIFKQTTLQKIINSYGPTECTDHSTFCIITRENISVSLGSPISNTKIFILDKDQRLLPQGVFGELCITGKGVSAGYYKREELTKEKFLPNPFGEGKLYRTGDIARWNSEGHLECLGRSDDQIKIHGVRIEKGEIESILLQHPDVISTYITKINDEKGNEHIVAYVIPDTVDLNALKEQCKAFLSIHMIPRWIIPMASFPITDNGKLNMKKLPSPFTINEKLEEETIPAHSSLIQLLPLFKKALKSEDILQDTNFFTAGGHSLLVLTLLGQIKSLFGIRIKLREFMEFNTPFLLSKYIDEYIRKTPSIQSPETYFACNDKIPLAGSSILIVGAGIAGIMAAIECKRRNIPFRIVEKSEGLGGIWRNGCNNASKLQTTSNVYIVDRMISHDEVYPNRAAVLQYLDKIFKFYDLEKYTTFNTEVKKVCRNNEGFLIETVNHTTNHVENLWHDGLLICSGKHQSPFIPSWNSVNGAPHIVHASCLDGVSVKDKEVIIIGGGSFAIEALRIAHEQKAKRITLLARKSYWVLPTFADTILLSGIDDTLKLTSEYDKLTSQLNKWLTQYYAQFKLSHFIPEYCVFDAHISTSDEFFKLSQESNVDLKIGEIEYLKKDGVVLKNKENISAELIIAATGYKDPLFPFLQPIAGDKPIVYKGFMLSNDPRIGFVGFLDMVTSATAVIPFNLDLCLLAMSQNRYRPSSERIQQWIQETPEDILSNVKSHISWLYEEKEYLNLQNDPIILRKIIDQSNDNFPENIAILEQDRSISYRELYIKTVTIASYILARGCKTVLTLLPETADATILLLGLFKRGCKIILMQENQDLSMFNLHETIDLIFMTKAVYSLNSEKYSAIAPIYFIEELDKIVDTECFCYLDTSNNEECIFFTSGSTGIPKGIVHTYESLSKAIENFGLTAWDRFHEPPRLLFHNHLAHLGGLMSCFSTLCKGGTVIFSSSGLENIVEDLNRYNPNLLILMSLQLTEIIQKHSLEYLNLKKVKHIVLGGEPLHSYHEEQLKHLPITFTFGISECGPLFKRRIGQSLPNELQQSLPGVQYHISYEKDSSVGELMVHSSSLFKGYYGTLPHSGWFKTGDLVESGQSLIYRGRKEERIQSNLFVQDIENQLLSSFPLKKAILSVENEKLYALLHPSPEARLHSSQIKNWIFQKYPNFETFITFQNKSHLNSTGKINRRILAASFNQPKVLLFPGQGIQQVGMGNHLKNHPLFIQADEVLGINLSEICSTGPQDYLNRTDICQIAIYTVSMIEIQKKLDADPFFLSRCKYALGLSLGEYCALTAVGALSFTDGLYLLSLRSKLMQLASENPPQAMVSISNLYKEIVLQQLQYYESLYLANDLGDEHVVIAGLKSSCQKFMVWAQNEGAHAVILNVVGAFHTPFMSLVANKFVEAIQKIKFQQPIVPILANYDGEPTMDPEMIKAKLIKQLDHPVQFSKALLHLKKSDILVEEMFEIGPKNIVIDIVNNYFQTASLSVN